MTSPLASPARSAGEPTTVPSRGPAASVGLDGPSALPLAQLDAFLQQVKAVDDLVKRLPLLDIR